MEVPELAALYGEAPESFVAARNALAKSLTRAGDRESAAAVKALRKPSVTAWALNQLSRARPADVERLVRVGTALREAQREALEGGDPDRLRDARRAHDDAVEDLTTAAERVLSDAGKPVGPTPRARLSATLHAVASDEEARELLLRGRLVNDFEPAGFGFGDEATGDVLAPPARSRPARPPRKAKPDRPARPPRPSRAQESEGATAARDARRLAAAADRAEARAARTARDAEHAERAAVELRRIADEAREAAVGARRLADAAHRQTGGARPVP